MSKHIESLTEFYKRYLRELEEEKKGNIAQLVLFAIALIVCLYLLCRLAQSGGWEQFNCGR
jgi:uncharacterized membrane protein